MGQAATADQAPKEVQEYGSIHTVQPQYASETNRKERVNYSVLESDFGDNAEWAELFPDSQR